jgi:hypothetical protein
MISVMDAWLVTENMCLVVPASMRTQLMRNRGGLQGRPIFFAMRFSIAKGGAVSREFRTPAGEISISALTGLRRQVPIVCRNCPLTPVEGDVV